MKILKVVVDELPKACINCGWANRKTCWLSLAAPLTDENMYVERPDWCPLILEEDVESWLMTRPQKPKYILCDNKDSL